MPDRIDKTLFISGLLAYLAGQVMLNVQGPVTRADTPIDVAHWLLLIGVSLLIPFAAKLPRRGIQLAAAPLLLIGIVAVIGMCVLDFVFWSVADPTLRGEIGSTLIDTPAVWAPFMVWGPNHVFGLGLALPSLMYVRSSRIGTGLVILGALVIAAGPAWFNVTGYALLTAGYGLCFRAGGLADKRAAELETASSA